MKTTQKCFVLFLGVWGLTAFPAAATECSTEKVNKSCTVTIDRNYPVTPPTIQMGKGEKVQVVVDHALPFETVTLDLQSAQTIAGTDQTQAIVTGGLAQAKSLVFKAASLVGPGAPATVHPPELVRLDNDLGRLVQSVESFGSNATKLYLELQEAVGTIPPQTLATGKRPQESPLLTFPAPPVPVAANFAEWKGWVLCELEQASCPGNSPLERERRGLLGQVIELNLRLTNLGTGVCPDNTKLADFDCRIKSFVNQKASMSPDDQIYLGRIESEYAVLVADAATLGAIAKDLGNYLVNIHELGAHPATANPGEIVDPVATNSVSGIVAKLLGRQVVYAVNVLNGVANLTASAPAASQRKSIATITVLFADPVLEASAGTFFSFLPSRTFTNQTLVAGGNTPGMTVIAQSLTRPNVVPFAAANVRLGPDFLIGNRRGALYATAAIGINTNTTTTEFAFGPSLSWRALMFSAFYHVGQDVRLTQNEQVGMPWPAGSTPPTPSTERFWTGAFAVGISVRVPSVFTGK